MGRLIMIWVAFWFVMLVMNTTDVVVAIATDRHGLGPLVDAAFAIVAAYFLATHIKKEFFDD